MGVRDRTWRGAALAGDLRAREIFPIAHAASNGVKQAAPANVSERRRSIGYNTNQ